MSIADIGIDSKLTVTGRPEDTMQTPLQITIRHMAHSPMLTARLHEEVEKLSGFYPDIVSCRVVIEHRDRHKSQGRSFNVRVALGVPGEELAVNHDHDEDVYVAVRDAFASLTRRLEDLVRRRRDAVKQRSSKSRCKMDPMAVGQD
jgi:ribosome-associated translation inhibitor RaiA